MAGYCGRIYCTKLLPKLKLVSNFNQGSSLKRSLGLSKISYNWLYYNDLCIKELHVKRTIGQCNSELFFRLVLDFSNQNKSECSDWSFRWKAQILNFRKWINKDTLRTLESRHSNNILFCLSLWYMYVKKYNILYFFGYKAPSDIRHTPNFSTQFF